MDLTRRLLAGERGKVPLHLAMLLEKSSSLDAGDDFYLWILPRALADLQLSQDTSEEIIAAVCAEISRNPDEALISVVSSTGSDLATKTVAKILAKPPRPLTMGEYSHALSLVTKFLPYCLEEDMEFLPKSDLERLVQLAKELQNSGGPETNEDRSARIMINNFAPQLIDRLKQLGIGGC